MATPTRGSSLVPAVQMTRRCVVSEPRAYCGLQLTCIQRGLDPEWGWLVLVLRHGLDQAIAGDLQRHGTSDLELAGPVRAHNV